MFYMQVGPEMMDRAAALRQANKDRTTEFFAVPCIS